MNHEYSSFPVYGSQGHQRLGMDLHLVNAQLHPQ